MLCQNSETNLTVLFQISAVCSYLKKKTKRFHVTYEIKCNASVSRRNFWLFLSCPTKTEKVGNTWQQNFRKKNHFASKSISFFRNLFTFLFCWCLFYITFAFFLFFCFSRTPIYSFCRFFWLQFCIFAVFCFSLHNYKSFISLHIIASPKMTLHVWKCLLMCVHCIMVNLNLNAYKHMWACIVNKSVWMQFKLLS